MPIDGPNVPSSVTEHPSLGIITDLGEIIAEDGASLKWPTGTYESKVIAKGFGFNVPSDATIQGLEVTRLVTRSEALGFPGNAEAANYVELQITLDGTTSGTGQVKQVGYRPNGVNQAFVNVGPVGGDSDLWSVGLTPAAVNDSNFGLIIGVTDEQLVPEVPTTNDELQIDYLELAVHYSDAGGGGEVTTAVLDAASMRYTAPGVRAVEGTTKK